MDDQFETASGRLFVCIEPPDYVREAVGRLRESYKGGKGLSWTAAEKLHVTLVFLGELAAERQEELARRLCEVEVQPFYLALEGVGVFPRKGRPQVLWAGMHKADPRLFQLHKKVEQVAIDVGVEPERRRYSPHVTMARCQAGSESVVAQILREQPDFGTAPFEVRSFALYSSQLTSEGALYRKMLEVPLGRA